MKTTLYKKKARGTFSLGMQISTDILFGMADIPYNVLGGEH